MKRLFILLGLLYSAALTAQEESHVFTNTKGQKLEATVVAFQDGQVTIRRRSDGKEFTLPLSGLIATDQAYVTGKVAGQGAKAGEEREAEIAPGVKMTFCWCPRGKFLMSEGAKAHPVSLTRGFWIGKFEVTQGQWQKVMGNNPSKFKEAGPSAPVEAVSWIAAQELTFKLGGQFHLPTEAQWEYACRAGSATAYYFGDDETKLGEYAWFQDNEKKPDLLGQKKTKTGTHPVGLKKPNAWNICDMLGNVAEWCADCFQEDLGTNSVTDPPGPSSGVAHVVRGGRWDATASDCRSVSRYSLNPKNVNSNLGLRVVADSIPPSTGAGGK
jgi:formylglycine-generating enzyme required for sulfatase activity